MRTRGLNFYAIFEQIINSFWTFIALRFTYEKSDLNETALIGLAVFFAVSASGLVRSMYVQPFYTIVNEDNPERIFSVIPLLSLKKIRTFILFMTLSTLVLLIFIEIRSAKSFFELFFLINSIVCLDFFRSFQQLNYGYQKLILADLVGVASFIGIHYFTNWLIAFNLDIDSLSAWIISNLFCTFLLFAQLKSTNHKNSTNSLDMVEFLSTPKKYSRLIAAEFIISRFTNLVGLAILYRINQGASANLALALFVYSTLPFSFSNGLLPVYFRSRLIKNGYSYRKRYFAAIAAILLLFPTTSILVPDLMSLIFGSLWKLPPFLILYVILSVALKTYDSAQSLDFMLQNQTSHYLFTKVPLIFLVNLISPVLLGLYSNLLSCIVIMIAMIIQIVIMEKKIS